MFLNQRDLQNTLWDFTYRCALPAAEGVNGPDDYIAVKGDTAMAEHGSQHVVGKRDLQLADKLRQEWPGILEWMIEGCLEWQKQGLVPPASVRKATEDYLTAEDTMGRWLEECCVVGNQIVTAVAMLFASWKRWCNENGEACGSQKAFSQKLSNRRFSSGKHCGKRSFQGLGLLDDSME